MATPRLPKVDGDEGKWGDILNSFLLVEHNTDGSLKKAGDIATAKTNASTALSTAQSAQAKADSAVQSVNGKSGSSVTLAASDVGAMSQTTADGRYVAKTSVGQNSGVAPLDSSGKVPAANLPAASNAVNSVNGKTGTVVLTASDVGAATTAQGSKADSAVQPGSLSAVATSGDYGDLSGTPTVPDSLDDLDDVATGGATSGQVLKYNGTSWAPAADNAGGSALTSTDDLAEGSTNLYFTNARAAAAAPVQTSDLFSGKYSDLTGAPALSPVATSGDYGDLAGTPTLATVATSGAYGDLSGTPDVPADLSDLGDVQITGTPTDGQVLKYSSGKWVPGVDNTSGSGSGPVSLGGDLSGTSDAAQIVAGAVGTSELADGGVTEDKLASAVQTKLDATAPVTSVNTKTGAVVLTASDVGAATTAQGGKADSAVQPGDLATVATSGDYSDLSGKPSLFSGSYTDLTDKPTVPSTLDDLSDVATTGVTSGQVLKYNGTSWAPATDNSGSGSTPTNLSATYAASSVTVASDTGTDATVSAATTTNAGVLSAADKSKLDGIQAGAEANVKADWNASTGDAQILNKPTLATVATSGSYTDLSNQPNLAAKANDSAVVHNTGAETVAGVKTFSSSPVVPTPTTNGQAANKSYVDSAVAGAGGGGGLSFTFVSKTANYTANNYEFVEVDSTSGAVTVTLPAPTANARVSVKRFNPTGNGVSVAAPSGSYIDATGVGTVTINNQYQSQDFLSDGTIWMRI